MPTSTDINNGLGLDEIIAFDAPDDTFASLKSKTVERLNKSLNPNVSGGIADLFKQLLGKTSGGQPLIADAIAAELAEFTAVLDEQIAADLAAQEVIINEQEAVSLAANIIPREPSQTQLLELVTTPQFRDILREEKII